MKCQSTALRTVLIFYAMALALWPATNYPASVKGEIVTIISPNSAGGMMTRYARMIAPYISKHSGARDVRVKIMTGAGGIKGTNFLWFSKPDGKTIAFTSIPSLILAQLSGSEAVQFDATQFIYLGRAATEPRVLTVGINSNISTIDDIRNLTRPFIFPSQGTDEDFYTMAVLAEALNIELKVISGYNGNADTALAVIKGDGDGHITSWDASMAIIQAGDELPILSLSRQRQSAYPGVPTAGEAVSEESRSIIEAIVNMLDMRRGFFAPPGMESTTASELRTAISKALADPNLISESEDRGLPLLPSDGLTEQRKIVQITKSSEIIVPILQEALMAIR